MNETNTPQEEAPQPAPSPAHLRVPPSGTWVAVIYDGDGHELGRVPVTTGAELRIVLEGIGA